MNGWRPMARPIYSIRSTEKPGKRQRSDTLSLLDEGRYCRIFSYASTVQGAFV